MPFVHFGNFKKPEPVKEEIVIHLQHPIFFEEELEEHIRNALNDGTFEQTTFVVPNAMGINLNNGDGSPMKFVSDEALSDIIQNILKKIKGEK